MFLSGWAGDKYHIRGPIIIANAVLTIVGLAIMGFTSSVGVRYFGVFLTCAGANSNIPQCMTFQANNIRGQWKRAFCSATLVGFGGVGGIAGSLVFRSQDAPEYHPGLYACIAASLVIILTTLLLDLKFYFDNKKQAAGTLTIEGSEVRPPSGCLDVHFTDGSCRTASGIRIEDRVVVGMSQAHVSSFLAPWPWRIIK